MSNELDRQNKQADAVRVVGANLEAALVAEEDRRRRAERERRGWRIFSVLLLVLMCLGGWVVHDGVDSLNAYIHQGRSVTTNTNHLVQEIDAALSPTAKADTAASIQLLVVNVVSQINEGNQRLCHQIITGLEKNGILRSGTADSICSSP